jgi:hypothetical protein
VRGWVVAFVILVTAGVPLLASRSDVPDVPYQNFPYNGRFTFVRLSFEPWIWGRGPYAWGLDLKWNHDYPRGERHFTKILDELTYMKPNLGGGNIIALNDPELFKYPWAYMCEPGFLTLTDEEAENIRTYLLKGGFLVLDDFILGDWDNFEKQMYRILPEGKLVQLEVSDPVFDSFFRIDSLDFPHPGDSRLMGEFYGIYEGNDPNKRLMILANYNMDIGDYWEWSDTGWIPIELSNEAYKLGVNYVVYGMTH